MRKRSESRSRAAPQLQQGESFMHQFTVRDVVAIILFIIILFALAYAVIQYNIVSQDDYLAAQQKYSQNPTSLVTTTSAPSQAEVLNSDLHIQLDIRHSDQPSLHGIFERGA